LTPAHALQKLRAGNARYVGDQPQAWIADKIRRAETAVAQKPFACVVTCSDSRVSPEILFDQSIGDLFVVRTAGTLLTPEVIGSVEFAIEPLGAQVIVILAHSHCGAIAAATSDIHYMGAVEAVIDRLRHIVEAKRRDGFTGLELQSEVSKQNSRNMFDNLLDKSIAIADAVQEKRVEIHRAFYDLHSGVVEWDYA
jgi:carbonic anhydrase